MRKILPLYFFLIFALFSSFGYAASYKDAEAALKAGLNKQAVAIWEDLAEEGDLASQLKLAQMYSIGAGVKVNKPASFKYYTQAAKQGSLEAQVQLAMIYMIGEGGVKQDREKAREMYRKAAYNGYAKAQYYYGVTYFRGEGVPTDYVQAHAWMRLAAIRGYEPAGTSSEQIEAALSKADLKKSRQITKKLLAEIKRLPANKIRKNKQQ